MSGQLNRLQAFLADAGELEIVAPPASTRPDYFGRFARLLGATLVASHVHAAAAPGPAASVSPTTAPPAAAAVIRDPDTTRAAIMSVKQLSARYLAHGRAPLQPQINMLNPDDDPEEGPVALIAPGEVCRVDGVRADYSKADPRLAFMADTEQMRAMLLVHESMHCRVGPALIKHIQQFHSPTVLQYVNIFNESSADAMAILTLARKDGVPVALHALDRVVAVRAAEAVSPDADGFHDTRETLKRVRNLLVNTPEKLNSDSSTFALAITETLAGASKTFKDALPPDRQGYLATPEFSADMAQFHKAVEKMADDYLHGVFHLGAPQVALNRMVAPPGGPSDSPEQLFLAKRAPAPAFTVTSLREQAEAITASVIVAAGGLPKTTVAASAPAPAQHANSMLAIGRLRSHLGAIYAAPLSEALAEHEHADVDEPAPPK